MILNFTQGFTSSVFTGIISNVIFTILILYGIQRLRYYYCLKRKFNNKTFNTYWKRFPNEIVQTVKCKVKGNVISFTGVKDEKTDYFNGEFIINPISLKSGEGFHFHNDSEGFAFLKIIIKDNNTFLVDAPYTGVKKNEKGIPKGFIMYQAFIWRKQNENK